MAPGPTTNEGNLNVLSETHFDGGQEHTSLVLEGLYEDADVASNISPSDYHIRSALMNTSNA